MYVYLKKKRKRKKIPIKKKTNKKRCVHSGLIQGGWVEEKQNTLAAVQNTGYQIVKRTQNLQNKHPKQTPALCFC